MREYRYWGNPVRVLRPGSGILHDLTLRRPWYISDWLGKEDTWRDFETFYRLVSGTIRIFFVNLLPALAYSLDMYYKTGGLGSTNEVLLASAIPAATFSLFSCQPLTIVGVTGLIDLFGYTTYDIVTKRYGVDYLSFMAWVGIWAAVMHWVIALFNWCDYMKYVTDFSSTAFGEYVGIIYIVKGVELIVEEFNGQTLANGYLSTLIALLYFFCAWFLEHLKHGTYLHRFVRQNLSDFALVIPLIFFTGFAHIPGNLKDVDVRKYPVTMAFQPSTDRDWFIKFWNIPVKWWFIAIPFSALVTALFYYDHNVSSLMAQARHFPLRKHAGFHWDFFLLGITTLVAGFIGIPYPNGLVPQAPVHTDCCAIIHYPSSKRSRLGAQLEKSTLTSDSTTEVNSMEGPKITRVLEQRWTHFGMALLLFGMMSRPLLVVLATVPRAVFAGVFIAVGWASIEGNPITTRTINLLHSPLKTPTSNPWKTVLFLVLQWLTVGAEVGISQTIAAIGFPVIILLLIPLRWTLMLNWFTKEELSQLDVATADNSVVLESLGGAPKVAERYAWEKPSNRDQNDQLDLNSAQDRVRKRGDVATRSPFELALSQLQT